MIFRCLVKCLFVFLNALGYNSVTDRGSWVSSGPYDWADRVGLLVLV